MKFWTGFTLGALAGGYVVTGMTAERRRSTARSMGKLASKVRSSQVGEAVAGGVSDVAEAVGERSASVIDRGTNVVADLVEPAT